MISNKQLLKVTGIITLLLLLPACENKSVLKDKVFKNVHVGMSKKEVAEQLVAEGITYAEPLVSQLISLKIEDSHALDSISKLDGICMDNSKGFGVKVAIYDSERSRIIYSSVEAENFFKQGDEISHDVLKERIRELFKTRSDIRVNNCIADLRSVDLKGIPLESDEKSYKVNGWLCYIPNSYSTALLYFSNDHLERIEFNERTHESP